MSNIIVDWEKKNSLLWDQQPLQFAHNMHQSELFEKKALVELLDNYPRDQFSIIHMGADDEEKKWQEGETNGLSGAEIFNAVEQGRLWVNLRNTRRVQSEYGALLAELFGELGDALGGRAFPPLSMGILISSPNAQVYYHCDLPNQSLLQIAGEKTIWVYPPQPPFLSGEDLERISIFELEVDLEYQKWFDDYAMKFALKPGQALNWPLNSPHKVVNGNMVNVSVTTEYWTKAAKLRHRINMANGMLRFKYGLNPRSRRTSGLGFWVKDRFDAVVSRTGWLEKVRADRRPTEFDIPGSDLGSIAERKP